jgi:RND superfamily putative drug exporter
MSNHAFASFGTWIFRHRWRVVIVWIALFMLFGAGAGRVTEVLQGGTGGIAGSKSEQASRMLHDSFANPYGQLLVLVTSSSQSVESPAYRDFLARTTAKLKGLGVVSAVTAYGPGGDRRLISADGHRSLALIGLKAGDLRGAEKAVEPVRQAIVPLAGEAKAHDPTFDWHVTGGGALTYDISRFSSEDSGKAEARGLPITALVLLFSFGTLVAAGLPLVIGMTAITVTLGLLFAVGQSIEFTAFAQSAASMLGMAMGIDYSLLMVNRFREALGRRDNNVEAAIAETMETAGHAVFFSGLTVLIGFIGLWFTPILDTRSIGAGGFAVVAGSMAIALTLLPAVLAILGPRIDAPRWLRLPTLVNQTEAWYRLAQRLLKRPLPVAIVSLVAILAMAAPARQIHLGFPTGDWLPSELEFIKGLHGLAQMGRSGAIYPVNIVLTADDNALATHHLPSLMAYSAKLRGDRRVSQVLSPVDLRDGLSPLSYMLLYSNVEAAVHQYPLIGQLFLSRDRHSTFFQVVFKDEVPFDEGERFSADLAAHPPTGYKVLVGGQAAYYIDLDRSLYESYPRVMGFVILATLLVMGIAFRSVLVPIKAVVLNLLSVAAGYGAVVAVFQQGFMGSLFGLQHPTGAIPLTVPLMLFCITFGLSMDYEVFLLTRIKEVYDQTRENGEAIARGLSVTAGIITSAALIMACVFGAFAFAQMVIVQMLGLGLAVSVLVDATLIRIGLVPALMRLAGDWNWWPGNRREPSDVETPLKTPISRP